MKRVLPFVLSVLLIFCSIPVTMASTVESQEIVVNVKDFGAVGDGSTNDRAAILDAFDYAIDNYASKSIPVTVYFPEGEYGLLYGGMYIYMPYGAGNLTVKGDGADKSTIVYLEDWVDAGSWVAIRIQLEESPRTEADYLHDITIQDMGVYDTDPDKHAWHEEDGDPSTEETHGFNIQYCVRATMRNCKVVDAGDECFDLSHCIDSVITENVVVKTRLTGKGGGSLSVGDGSRNVTVTNNLVLFDTEDSSRSHYGMAVEALTGHTEDIHITNNTFTNVNGWGVNLVAPNGTIADILVENNVMTGCLAGGVHFSGAGQTDDVLIRNNEMSGVGVGVHVDGGNKDRTVVENCTIDEIADCGIKVTSPSSNDTVIRNVTIRNSQGRAVYNAGTNTKLDCLYIDGVGLAGGITDGAITQYGPSGSSELTNSVLVNCQTKKGTQCVQKVINTIIEQPEISGYVSLMKVDLVQNCCVSRYVQPNVGCTIDGLVLRAAADLGIYAVYLNNMSGCTVNDCIFIMPSRHAVYENGSADNNVITNNVMVGGKGIKVIGAGTVATGNATGTEGTYGELRYRLVDGEVAIIAPTSKKLTSVTIPATIEGYPVTAIDPWAFALCRSLSKITIADSVTSIGKNAFYLCDALVNVHYTGSRKDWARITIGDSNGDLLNAAWYSPAGLYAEAVRHSVMDTANGNGLAFRFELAASGITAKGGNQIDLTNATVNYFGEECRLIGVGAVATNNAALGEGGVTLDSVNGASVLDIPTIYLQDVTAEGCAFATRIIDIPSSMLARNIYVRPYYVVEVDGEQSVIYGDTDSASCIEYM